MSGFGNNHSGNNHSGDKHPGDNNPREGAADPVTRRHVLLVASAAAVTTALPDAALAQVKAVARAPLAAGKFLNGRELAILDEVAELIIPADEQSGGAKAAKCALYIDARLAESIDPEWRKSWKEDLREIDETAGRMFGRSFLDTTPAERIRLMDRISRNEDKKPVEDVNYAFGTIKWWVAEAYYTSEVGMRQELKYQGNSYIDEFVGQDVLPIDRT